MGMSWREVDESAVSDSRRPLLFLLFQPPAHSCGQAVSLKFFVHPTEFSAGCLLDDLVSGTGPRSLTEGLMNGVIAHRLTIFEWGRVSHFNK